MKAFLRRALMYTAVAVAVLTPTAANANTKKAYTACTPIQHTVPMGSGLTWLGSSYYYYTDTWTINTYCLTNPKTENLILSGTYTTANVAMDDTTNGILYSTNLVHESHTWETLTNSGDQASTWRMVAKYPGADVLAGTVEQ